MSTKLTFDQFLVKKEELKAIYREFEQKDEILEEDNPILEEFINKYYGKQTEILSYDLSDIPTIAWTNFLIYSDEKRIADFSKTHANIDFAILDVPGYCNFEGCNVSNIKYINHLQFVKFDKEVINNNQDIFLSDLFSQEFKDKFYARNLTFEDLIELTTTQLEELKQKDLEKHLNIGFNRLIMICGIDKALELYKYNKKEFQEIDELIKINISQEDLEKLLSSPVSDIKNNLLNYHKNKIINEVGSIFKGDYPEIFISAYPDLFLENKNIPDDIKRDYFHKSLKVKDYLDYIEEFNDIPIDNFIFNSNYIIAQIQSVYGKGQFQKLAYKYKKIFEKVYEKLDFSNYFQKELAKGKDLETTFIDTIKEYYIKRLTTHTIEEKELTEAIESTFNFRVIDHINSIEELLKYDDKTIIKNDYERAFVNNLGIDNIKRFEEETRFFSGVVKDKLSVFEMDMYNLIKYAYGIDGDNNLNHNNYPIFIAKLFKNGTLSYEEFKDKFANLLNTLRKGRVFRDINYDYLEGEFREKHPSIFIDKEAPEDLRNLFYKGNITLSILKNHPEYYPYLMNYNLKDIITDKIILEVPELNDGGFIKVIQKDFIEEFCKRYGNEKFFALVDKYGAFLNVTIDSLNGEINYEELIYKQIRSSIYNEITTKRRDVNYYNLINVEEFKREYPELFIDLSEITRIPKEKLSLLEECFYNGKLSFEDIRDYPELIPYLKDKNLFACFKELGGKNVNNRIILRNAFNNLMYSDLELLEFLGNEKFLELCKEYGKYLNGVVDGINAFVKVIDGKYYSISDKSELSFEEIKKLIENYIYKGMFLGDLPYDENDVPDFLKKEHPELFLEENAPEELKEYIYMTSLGMNFEILSKHKEWVLYLKGKAITPFLRNCLYKQEMINYFEVFGEEDAYRLGISKPKTVEEMLRCHQTQIMKIWYDKTGKKFIPDYIVMQNFSVEEIDKFLASGKQWSTLMKIKRYANNPDSRDALLKLAYTFGVFDNDLSSMKKLDELINGIPRKLNERQTRLLRDFEISVNKYNINITGKEEYNEIFRELNEKELVNKGEVFSKIYQFNEDGTATLKINPQENKKISDNLRIIMEEFGITLNPHQAHIYFGGFELKYDKDFREFFLKYYDVIMSNPDYTKYLPSIQKQFGLIKIFNSNRTLTLDLAINFVTSNKYIGVEPGNEKVADLATKVGYSQKDFETLQQIYNYGKLRTFSSIPRIENRTDKYSYELLRVDDPLALVIGPETNCCQSLGQAAEVCMEHSMVSNDGRVFVIKDNDGNIIAQSWVWRNKGVLCFDNIEIPDKAFERFTKTNRGSDNSDLANEVFEVYKKAAEEIMEQDDIIYKELLESGKITEEQYNGLRISKITIGKGFNDIASALQENLEIDKEEATFPKEFVPPVDLPHSLYISDSRIQYILNERQDKTETNEEALYVHKDTYKEYTDKDFTLSDLFVLEKLEIITKGRLEKLSDILYGNEASNDIVTRISDSYRINPNNTRIIMNANFGIIFEKEDSNIKIVDLFFNRDILKKYRETLVLQIKLAIEQIGEGKEIDIYSLNEEQIELYEEALQRNIDISRGESFGR